MMQSQTSFPGKPKLLDQLRTFMRARRYSLRTEEAYLDWIRRFILFHGKRHPRDLGEQEITEFLADLAVHRHVAASTQNQALSALLFLYQQFFERKLGRLDDALRVSRPARVPVVLTREECARCWRMSRRRTASSPISFTGAVCVYSKHCDCGFTP